MTRWMWVAVITWTVITLSRPKFTHPYTWCWYLGVLASGAVAVLFGMVLERRRVQKLDRYKK